MDYRISNSLRALFLTFATPMPTLASNCNIYYSCHFLYRLRCLNQVPQPYDVPHPLLHLASPTTSSAPSDHYRRLLRNNLQYPLRDLGTIHVPTPDSCESPLLYYSSPSIFGLNESHSLRNKAFRIGIGGRMVMFLAVDFNYTSQRRNPSFAVGFLRDTFPVSPVQSSRVQFVGETIQDYLRIGSGGTEVYCS